MKCSRFLEHNGAPKLVQLLQLTAALNKHPSYQTVQITISSANEHGYRTSSTGGYFKSRRKQKELSPSMTARAFDTRRNKLAECITLCTHELKHSHRYKVGQRKAAFFGERCFLQNEMQAEIGVTRNELTGRCASRQSQRTMVSSVNVTCMARQRAHFLTYMEFAREQQTSPAAA